MRPGKTKTQERRARVVARRIVKMLFTNGIGKRAARLMLEMPDKSDGGGWGEHGALAAVYEILIR